MTMNVLERMTTSDHEEVIFFHNKEVGLKAIVAIHSTVLGPALGGTRMWPYKNEEEALRDVLRLSEGMTYKAAAAGLNLGGGKAVIIGDPKQDKSQALFRMYGRFINTLGGRFITAEDVGIDVNDIEYVYTETDYVVGIETSHGGSGDPSPYTALGVLQGIKACLKRVFNDESLAGRTVVVQGVGHVGRNLTRLLADAGAKVFVSDLDQERVDEVCATFGVESVPLDQIFQIPCDVFAPCALGAVINAETLPQLKCKIIAGAANNQLDTTERAQDVRARGIVYAPDYVINAGGLINVSLELDGYSAERAERLTRGIYYNLLQIFQLAEAGNLTNAQAADLLVERRLGRTMRMNNIYTANRKDSISRIRERRALSAVVG